MATEDGDVVTVKRGPEHKVIATKTIADGFFTATPAITDGEIYLPGHNAFFVLGKPVKSGKLVGRGRAGMSLPVIFVSYSHQDRAWLERLQVHLRPLVRESRIEAWDDTKIQPGAAWQDEIRAAIERAAAAVLLISADFLASDFVASEELPKLLESAEERGLRILQVIVGPSRFARTALARLQTVNSPESPLTSLGEYERELVFDRLAQRLESVLQTADLQSQVDTVATRLDEINNRVSELFLATMSLAMYQNLKKIVNPPFGRYQLGRGLRRELEHLRTIGYIEIDGLARIPKEGENLSDFVRPTQTGERFVALREEIKSLRL